MRKIPLPSSVYTPGPVPAAQINADLYGIPAEGPSGVLFHARRPLLSETVITGGTAYSPLAAQPVAGPGLQAYTVIDTTALAGPGADYPGRNSAFTFQNWVPASSGTAGFMTGQWLSWGFPWLGPVTAPPGGVGAGMTQNSGFANMGVFQYGSTGHNNCPWYLDLVAPGAGSVNTWKPSFWWLTPSTPTVIGNASDTSGQATRMGWLWQSVSTGLGGTVSSVPAVASSWGTVTSGMLNGMGSALTFLDNPPSFRVATTSGQSVPNNSDTVLQFTAAPGFDNYTGWSTASSAYTAPLPGLYLLCPTTVWGTASPNGTRRSGLQVTASGTTYTYQGPNYAPPPVGPGTTGTGLCATAVARVLSLGAGDTVSAYGWQNSGASLPLYTGYSTRLVGAYMTQQAPAGSVLSYTAPVTGFRFQAGLLSGTALAATLGARIGNDVNFLLNRPYFTGYQATAQTGFGDNTFYQVTMDTLGAPPRGGNGDSYGGWSAANHWYVSQVAGWYLCIADLYAVPPVSGTAGILHAGFSVNSSGGIVPSSAPDGYQQVYYPVSTGGPPPGVTAIGMYYLQPGEHVHPVISSLTWGGTWGTYVSSGTANVVHSQFSCFWVSE